MLRRIREEIDGQTRGKSDAFKTAIYAGLIEGLMESMNQHAAGVRRLMCPCDDYFLDRVTLRIACVRCGRPPRLRLIDGRITERTDES
jgi:hypothetical protein